MPSTKQESEYNIFDWWKKVVYDNYANFDGRARRSEYWYFTLFNIIVAMVAGILFFITGALFIETEALMIIPYLPIIALGLYLLFTIIPGIAVAIRRLHDTGKSGWWYLLGVIPIVSYIGGIVLLVFYCMDSDVGRNEYGPNPKNIGNEDLF